MTVEAAVPRAGTTRRHVVDLVLHLAHRRLMSQNRFTVLGWVWPLIRQLAQLAVLVFVFGRIFDIGIEDYPVFVFTGLLLFGTFAAGLSDGVGSLVSDRHLVFTPRFPTIALPLVAVAVPVIDLLLALPILLVFLVVEDRLAWTALLLPALLMVQYVFTAGLALLFASANVFFRDVGNVVGLGVTLLFYVTPVFYGFRTIPEQFQVILQLNPMTAFLNVGRDLLFDGRLPRLVDVVIACGAAAAAATLGLLLFRRLRSRFVDHL